MLRQLVSNQPSPSRLGQQSAKATFQIRLHIVWSCLFPGPSLESAHFLFPSSCRNGMYTAKQDCSPSPGGNAKAFCRLFIFTVMLYVALHRRRFRPSFSCYIFHKFSVMPRPIGICNYRYVLGLGDVKSYVKFLLCYSTIGDVAGDLLLRR
ncbi:hypothetical protein DFS33DRAFT_246413 [Desarmillaria ectypa]|nr:hypothetical protein DFS33DRAFT_246413 [Desarmillaria ectypa]